MLISDLPCWRTDSWHLAWHSSPISAHEQTIRDLANAHASTPRSRQLLRTAVVESAGRATQGLATTMDHPAASHASPPSTPGIHTHTQRPSTATMRTHNRSQSRMAEVASRSSDEDVNRTAVKVGTCRAWSKDSHGDSKLTCDD